MITVLSVLLNFALVFSNPLAKDVCQTGCQSLLQDKINVHLVPHSHDDVGWLKTYDQYYVGTGDFNSYANAGVQYILSSTIEALQKDSNRRFIQVETAFFWRWWNDQTSETRSIVKDMVNKGQLEMINGGWSMNDEAAVHYQSVIDQFTWGFRILEDTVGTCGRPKIGWQIDPFGHSREHASIVKQLGFEGLVVGRIDYRDKEKRKQDQNLDFYWNTNKNFAEEDAKIFTTMFPNFYTYETGFCFDVTCTDTEITDANRQEKVEKFAAILDKYAAYYKTKNILIPMGNDFSYQKAEKNFRNNDQLITGFKGHKTYNLLYSTPSCYIQAVKNEISANKVELTVKEDDFFPYASDIHSYWTGYFTSRPTSKRFERTGNNILQSAKQLTTFSRTKGTNDDDSLLKLRMAMGVLQHHDAITGTEKQAVAENYHLLLHEAIKEAEKPVSNIIRDLLKKQDVVSVDLKLSTCLLSNVSICDTTKKDRFLVAVQNPLSKVVSHYVRLPVDGENYKITGPDGDEKFDIFDTMHSFDFVSNEKPASKELIFLAKELPPLGLKLYYVEKLSETSDSYHKFENSTENESSFGDSTTNGFAVDSNGKLKTVTINGQGLDMVQEFYYYNGFSASGQASGAYIFRPDGAAIPINEKPSGWKFAKGSLVDEVLQQVNDEITQIIRVYKGETDSYIEFDWLVGDLKLQDQGKEIITRFALTDFKNNDIFYTDANGRQQVERHRNQRSDYVYDYSEEPVSSNYYPVTSKIVIKDTTKKIEVAVLNDRAQGGSSLTEGVVELMIHRREKRDDGFGVSEVLNEQQYGKGLYVRGQHYLTFGKIGDADHNPVVLERDLAHRKLLAPWILVGDATVEALSTVEKVQALLEFKFEALTKSLPDNVQMLTLEPWTDSYLLRLEHIFEKDEDTNLSKEVTVDLTDLFTLFNVTELTSVRLGANQNLEGTSAATVQTKEGAPNLVVTLKPMEIKTFVFKTDKNNAGGTHNGIENPPNASQTLSPVPALFLLMVVCIYNMLW